MRFPSDKLVIIYKVVTLFDFSRINRIIFINIGSSNYAKIN